MHFKMANQGGGGFQDSSNLVLNDILARLYKPEAYEVCGGF
jgi:hypothetical protein